jgi:murein DD-endopeptidase MepM/ murein hydrolase activator NlpD
LFMGKSQVTVYLTLGLIISVVYLIFSLHANSVDKTEILSSQKDTLSSIVSQCTEQQLYLAIKDYGISNESIPFIEKEMSGIKDCVKQISFSPYEVIIFEPTAKVELFDEVILVDLVFPITITDGNTRLEFKGNIYTFPRTRSVNIKPGATLMSSDDNFEIKLPEDILYSPNSLSVKSVDKMFNGQYTSLLHGNTVYEVLPKEMAFNRPVTLTMFFDSDIEEDLVLGYYEVSTKLWIGLPTRIEGNRIIAPTDHFTVFGALNCQPKTKMIISLPENGDLFECNTGYDNLEHWVEDKQIEIPLGDACINIGGSNPVIKTKGFNNEDDSNDGYDLLVEAINTEDSWEITDLRIEDGKIKMIITATNTNGDACLPGMIRASFFGIASSEENSGFGGITDNTPGAEAAPSIGYVAQLDSPASDLPAGSLTWPLSDICSRRLTCGYLDSSPLCNNVEGRAHSGLDWGGFGMTVYSIADGEVVYASGAKTHEVGEWYGYGKVILIRHNINGKTMYSLYAHLSSIDIIEGAQVSAGQKIGLTGSTGYSSGPHLHFELRKEPGTYQTDVNPRKYLPKMEC